MIIVTGSVTARPDSFEALLAAAQAHVARSRAEPGCISHAVYGDVEDPLRLFFFEQWADQQALETHYRQPGSGELMSAIKALAVASGKLETFTVRQD